MATGVSNCEMDRHLSHWFVDEILAHEAALMRYLMRVWNSRAEVSDLRQETYARVYESAARVRPRSPKSFLFATAHNLMIDKMRRERFGPVYYTQDFNALHGPVDELTPERRLTAQQEFQRLADAFDGLPEMTKAAIWLRRVEGLSQRETAQALGIKEGALEGHMTRGRRSLANTILSNSRANGANPAGAQARSGCIGPLQSSAGTKDTAGRYKPGI